MATTPPPPPPPGKSTDTFVDSLRSVVETLDRTRDLVDALEDVLGVRRKLNTGERASLNIIREVEESHRYINRELRLTKSLESQLKKDRKTLNKLTVEELFTYKEISESTKAKAETLTAIAKTVGTQSELYAKVLGSVNDLDRKEVQRLVSLRTAKRFQEEMVESREEELKVQAKANKYLGLTGALVDNLQNIGLRAFGGLGINLSVFEEGIKDAKDTAVGLANSFADVDKIIQKAGGIDEFKTKIKGGTDEALHLKNEILNVSEALVLASKRQDEYRNLQEEIKEGEVAYEKEVAKIESERVKLLEKFEASKLSDELKGRAIKVINSRAQRQLKLIKSEADALEDKRENLREISVEVAKQNFQQSTFLRQLRTMKAVFPGIGNAIKSGILDPLSISLFSIKAIKDNFTALNKAQTEFRRLTGESADTFTQITSRATNALEVIEVLVDLTKKLGFNAQGIFSDKDLVRLSEAKNLLALSSEQTTNLARFSRLSADSIEGFENSFSRGVKEGNKLTDSAISAQQALQDALNTSDGIALSLGLSGEELGKASTAAKALGVELSKVDSIASSLLDFESSIENELQAQLLTGKQLNLSKARELALNNDLAGVAKEVTTNIVSATEFANMNRIAQEGLASAIGVGRDELASMIIQQEMSGNLSDEMKAKIMGMTLEQYKQQTAMDNLKRSVQGVAQAIAGIIEPFANFIAQNESLLKVVLGTVAAYKAFVGLSKVSAVLTGIVLGLRKKEGAELTATIAKSRLLATAEAKVTAQKVAQATASTIGNPAGALIGLALTGAVLGSILYASKKMKSIEDGYDPNGGPVVSMPKGSLGLEPVAQGIKGDQWAMGTELIDNNKQTRIQPPPKQSIPDEFLNSFNDIKKTNKELTERFDKLIKIVEKGGTVNIDGRYAGEALVLGSYNSA